MIADTIQAALTPVFALVAIASILNFLTTRLGRVVDRSRVLQQLHASTQGVEHDMVVSEIRVLAKRIELVGRAILMLVLSGLCIGVTVIILFLQEFTRTQMEQVAGGVFMVSIVLLLTGLVLFLFETRVASASLRIPATFLELDRRL